MSASRRLPLYLSPPHPCSYLPGRQSSTLFVDPDLPMDMATYSELLRYGFRRSGRIVYAPRCEGCAQCISVRIPVSDFAPRRTHRRIQRANADLTVNERQAGFVDAHFALYQAYTRARHQEGEMADASAERYLDFLCADWCSTTFLEFHRGQRLVAVAVTDRLADGLSAVYTFFDPELAGRSLGTFAILAQIERARTLNLPYLYLGYWIRDSQKMAYKGNFRPIELSLNGRWERFQRGTPLPGG